MPIVQESFCVDHGALIKTLDTKAQVSFPGYRKILEGKVEVEGTGSSSSGDEVGEGDSFNEGAQEMPL